MIDIWTRPRSRGWGKLWNCQAYFQALATIAHSEKLSNIIALEKCEIRYSKTANIVANALWLPIQSQGQ